MRFYHNDYFVMPVFISLNFTSWIKVVSKLHKSTGSKFKTTNGHWNGKTLARWVRTHHMQSARGDKAGRNEAIVKDRSV